MACCRCKTRWKKLLNTSSWLPSRVSTNWVYPPGPCEDTRGGVSQTSTASYQFQNALPKYQIHLISNTKHILPNTKYIHATLPSTNHTICQIQIEIQIHAYRQYVPPCGTGHRAFRSPSRATRPSCPAWTPTRASNTPPSVSTWSSSKCDIL